MSQSSGSLRARPDRALFPAIVTVLCLPSLAAAAQLTQTDDAPKNQNMASGLDEMRKLAETIKAFAKTENGTQRMELVQNPLLRFNDAARSFPDGTLWAWGRVGRPAALLCIALYTPTAGVPEWNHEFTSLSAATLTAEGSAGQKWSPQKPGLTMQVLPDATTPADTSANRLRQMKELARRFSAFEILRPQGQRYELRLLTSPVHQYAHPDSGLIDGTIFIFAYGTNPEVALLIEAERTAPSLPVWRYGLAPISAADLFVNLNDREVWSQPQLQTSAVDTYWYFRIPSKRKE
jgi:hypothetical protein